MTRPAMQRATYLVRAPAVLALALLVCAGQRATAAEVVHELVASGR